MSGSAGQGFNGNQGGQGGMSIFTYTLLKNTEYTFKLGCTVEPTSSIGRGGAGAYFYEGGRLLVACGGGGASGWERGSDGGHGGGAGVPGRAGQGRGGGEGGIQVNTGELTASGSFNIGGSQGGGAPGGKVESCTTGQYWRDQGIAPCAFMGTGKFTNYRGITQSNTSDLVNRGYKADVENYGYRHNGGNSTFQKNGTFVGGGGSGAYGGAACGSLSSGGGGGSGYTNGSVNLIFGQVGGNKNSQASALIELVTRPGQKMIFLVRGG